MIGVVRNLSYSTPDITNAKHAPKAKQTDEEQKHKDEEIQMFKNCKTAKRV